MFHICTIMNNLPQYEAMKSSLLSAGFSEEHCRYEVFDNSKENAYDPYQTINQILAATTEPYVIFCHQDILLDKGDGFEQLVDRLEDLTQKDPSWAVAGNAGYAENLVPIIRISDPTGYQNYSNLPERVYSLDENFLVIRTESRVHCSHTIKGFHLYATDLCLQAVKQGKSCYVIDFYLTHLSAGNFASEDFHRSIGTFIKAWDHSFALCLVRTPCTFFYLSRSRVIRRILRSTRVMKWITKHISIYTRTTYAKKRVEQIFKRINYALPE